MVSMVLSSVGGVNVWHLLPAQVVVEDEAGESQAERHDEGVDKQGHGHGHSKMLAAEISDGEPDEEENHAEDALFVVHGFLLECKIIIT